MKMNLSRFQGGLTLVELMVAVLLFTILAGGTLVALQGQQSAVLTQQRNDTTLDNARSALKALIQQIQTANAGITTGQIVLNDIVDAPAGVTLCGASSDRVAVIEVTNSSTDVDELRFIRPDGQNWGSMSAAPTAPGTSVQFRTSDGTAPGYAIGDWVLMSDYSSAVMFKVTAAPAACNTSELCVGKAAGNPGVYPTTFQITDTLFGVQWMHYAISTSLFGSDMPALMLSELGGSGTSEPVAVGIEDFQVALGIDVDNDGAIGAENTGAADADEWVFNVAGETVTTTAGTDSCTLSRLLAVRVSLVAMATQRDQGARASRPALEDRSAGTADGKFRVVLQAVIGLRNR